MKRRTSTIARTARMLASMKTIETIAALDADRFEIMPCGSIEPWAPISDVVALKRLKRCAVVTARCADGWTYLFHLYNGERLERSIAPRA